MKFTMDANKDDGSEVRRGPNRDDEFAVFFAANWTRMFRTAYAVSCDVGAAEDATQTAFAKAWASWHRVGQAEHPEAYLRRMVVNEVLGLRRRVWWRRERPNIMDPHSFTETSLISESSVDDAATNREALWAVVMALPPRQRAVVVLRYYEDLSEAEIADVLGCRRGTVKSQASAALSTLRQLALRTNLEESQ